MILHETARNLPVLKDFRSRCQVFLPVELLSQTPVIMIIVLPLPSFPLSMHLCGALALGVLLGNVGDGKACIMMLAIALRFLPLSLIAQA